MMKRRRWTGWLILPIMALGMLASPTVADTAVTPINSRDYFPALIKLIDNSKHSIKVCAFEAEHYEEYPGSQSNLIIEGLIAAAKRGVEVTVILDRSGFRNEGEHDAKNMRSAKMLAEAGASVYMDPDEIVSHQKMVVFDRDVVVVASVNWKHYSLNLNNEVAVILWSKEAGRKYGEYFAERLGDATRFAPEGTQLADLTPGTSTLSPESLGLTTYMASDIQYLNNRWFYPELTKALRAATTTIDVVQNYANWYDKIPNSQFVQRPEGKPSETNLLLDELIAAHKRGVKVRLMLDVTAQADFTRPWDPETIEFARRAMAAGIEVYRDDPSVTTHAKYLVIDSSRVVVGSTNWSWNALEQGNECSVLITSPELTKQVYIPYTDAIFATGAPVEDVDKINLITPAPTAPPEDAKAEEVAPAAEVDER